MHMHVIIIVKERRLLMRMGHMGVVQERVTGRGLRKERVKRYNSISIKTY